MARKRFLDITIQLAALILELQGLEKSLSQRQGRKASEEDSCLYRWYLHMNTPHADMSRYTHKIINLNLKKKQIRRVINGKCSLSDWDISTLVHWFIHLFDQNKELFFFHFKPYVSFWVLDENLTLISFLPVVLNLTTFSNKKTKVKTSHRERVTWTGGWVGGWMGPAPCWSSFSVSDQHDFTLHHQARIQRGATERRLSHLWSSQSQKGQERKLRVAKETGTGEVFLIMLLLVTDHLWGARAEGKDT